MIYSTKAMLSPVGLLTLIASSKGLAAILWENDRRGRQRFGTHLEASGNGVLIQAERELHEYFDGERTVFSVVLDISGTEFQKQVWWALLTIPFGETRSYGKIATQIGRPKASRAVGAANSRNPLSIIAPCHRVIGSDGSLTGFGGGLDTKEYLLRHKRARVRNR